MCVERGREGKEGGREREEGNDESEGDRVRLEEVRTERYIRTETEKLKKEENTEGREVVGRSER